ncbi:NAD(P)H-dependent oxidoreductase [Runella sp. MFBS21]|uniref:NAD(P)H-dependent oxidoreductase n=1 Tax=Runella sp. MFBS21 TaxID=3034018 RepID=UPI0023F80C2D|nr:NAD(P)H-dependent oxidoreductase [Runella sp. MFBS21]MDF7821069.1 NAD(P)H-dependent oxidoreductase [Runella sp. MFBS21]
MKKNILLLLGHPSDQSFCNALLEAYQKGAESAGANCKIIKIANLEFDVNLADGYKKGEAMQLEKDLVESQQLIQWADHLVLVYPNWWGFMPAVTKGFFDRIFLPGFAFKNHSGKSFPEKLLKGKSIRIMVTMDTPKLWFYLIYRASQYQILKDIIFGYVGFDPIRFSTFGFIRKSTDELRAKWLAEVKQLGEQLK